MFIPGNKLIGLMCLSKMAMMYMVAIPSHDFEISLNKKVLMPLKNQIS